MTASTSIRVLCVDDHALIRDALTLKVDSANPLVGHHHRPNAEARLMGVTVRTNTDGFRDDDYAVERNGKRRIVFLGDSLTLGWGVEQADTFEHVLEARLDAIRPTEVINLGVGNYNTTQELNLFLDKGAKYLPDQVVLFYFINDAEPVPQKSRFPGLGHSRLVTFYWSRLKMLRERISPGAGFAASRAPRRCSFKETCATRSASSSRATRRSSACSAKRRARAARTWSTSRLRRSSSRCTSGLPTRSSRRPGVRATREPPILRTSVR